MKKLYALIALLLCLVVSPVLAQQPQTQTDPLYAVNAQYVNGVAPGYAPTWTSGTLTLNLGGGTANCAGTIATYAAGTLTMAASATNYVYLNTAASCAPAVKTTAFTSSDIAIATVVTGSSSISSVADDRTQFVSFVSSGSLPPCSTNQLPYYASSGTTVSCLSLGTNLSISGGTLNGGGGSGLSVCADTSGSGTAQSCTTSPIFTPVANSCVIYTTTTANSGAGLTINVNSLGAKSVAKWQGAVTLAVGDVAANKPVLACYDGADWNLSTIGNAPTGGSGSPSSPSYSVQFANSGSTAFTSDPDITINPTNHALNFSAPTQGVDALGVGTGTVPTPSATYYSGWIGPASGTPSFFSQMPAAAPSVPSVYTYAAPTTVNGASQSAETTVPLAGAGAAIPTGPATTTPNDCPYYINSSGQLGDSGAPCGGLGITIHYSSTPITGQSYLVQSAYGAATSKLFANNVTSGNFLVAIFSGGAGTPSSATCSDTLGNAWTMDLITANTSGSTVINVAVCHTVTSTGGPDTVTLGGWSPTFPTADVQEYHISSPTFDTSASQYSAVAGTVSANLTLAGADLVIAVLRTFCSGNTFTRGPSLQFVENTGPSGNPSYASTMSNVLSGSFTASLSQNSCTDNFLAAVAYKQGTISTPGATGDLWFYVNLAAPAIFGPKSASGIYPYLGSLQ